MAAAPTLSIFLLGAGLLALWIDARFPKLAPDSFSHRILVAAGAALALAAAPVFHGSTIAVYATLFAIVLPILVSSLLAAIWMLRALREAHFSG